MMMDQMSADEMEQLQAMHYQYMNMVDEDAAMHMEVDQVANQLKAVMLTDEMALTGSMAEDEEIDTPKMSLTPADVLTGDDDHEPDGGKVDWDLQRVEYLLEGIPPNELAYALEEPLTDDDSKMSVDSDQADKSLPAL